MFGTLSASPTAHLASVIDDALPGYPRSLWERGHRIAHLSRATIADPPGDTAVSAHPTTRNSSHCGVDA